MIDLSQSLDMKFCEKLALMEEDEADYSESEIIKQFVGEMFDDFHERTGKRKITLALRIKWFFQRISDSLYNLKYAFRNHCKWRKTINELRPWEGYSGLIGLLITHLNDYIETEKKYGHSEEEYKKKKIASAKETVEILERMKDPDEYLSKARNEVDERYPKYKGLVTNYKKGGSSYSGDFVQQGNGWVGEKGGKDPRRGYFEFINGRFQLTQSPDQTETDKLLNQMDKYHEEVHKAYEKGNNDSDKDFERLGELLKSHMYTWWD